MVGRKVLAFGPLLLHSAFMGKNQNGTTIQPELRLVIGQ
jgi:hypothetical protein